MKHFIPILFFAVLLLSCSHSGKELPQDDTSKVMVCMGRYAKRYHDSRRRSLKSCRGEVLKIPIAEARNAGYTPCGYCYR